MSTLRLESVLRAVAVAIVAIVGLIASTPNIHGTADTRGGALCDVNRVDSYGCGDTGYSGHCAYLYKKCSAVAGWKYQTCVLKSMATNDCAKDTQRCFPRDDYMPTGNCTATNQ